MPHKLIDDFIAVLNVHKPEARKAAADELWSRLSGVTLPITHKNRAYFLYKGNAETVTLVGDWTYWQPAIKLQKIDHTDLFYSIQEFHPTARLQYKLIVDGNWMLDPANPHSSIEGFGQNSEFWMPEYHDESWLQPHSAVVHRGNIKRFEFKSKLLGQQREMFLYTPHYKLEKNQTLPLLIVHDGAEAIKIGKFHQILDNLQAAGKIPPCAALFISPKDRIGEYALKANILNSASKKPSPKRSKSGIPGAFRYQTALSSEVLPALPSADSLRPRLRSNSLKILVFASLNRRRIGGIKPRYSTRHI